MFNLFTSNSEFRLVLVAVSALLSFVVVDDLLYRQHLFLKVFGGATQEGQVIAKKERAFGYAGLADVILFGSSFTRSGISSEPFTNNKQLVFNAAVSGGGPIYNYYALDEMSAELRKRDRMPLLVLELHPDALHKNRPQWSEYPQYVAMVRERGRALRDVQLLFRNFFAYGQASRFLSGLLFPSLIYREHNRQIQHGLGELFQSGRKPMGGYFIGMEDHGGYSPIYTAATSADCVGDGARDKVLHVHSLESTKVAFVRRFLDVATELGAPVLLIERPNLCHDQLMAQLVDQLRLEYPEIAYLSSGELGLSIKDFQSSNPAAHPNLWGADKVGQKIVHFMNSNKKGNTTFQERWDGIYGDSKSIEWEVASEISTAQKRIVHFAEQKAQGVKAPGVIAFTKEIHVEAGQEYILEGLVELKRGMLHVQVEYRNTGEAEFHDGGYYPLPESDKPLRHFIRFRPPGGSIRILLHSADPQHQAVGEYELLRIVEDRAGKCTSSDLIQKSADKVYCLSGQGGLGKT